MRGYNYSTWVLLAVVGIVVVSSTSFAFDATGTRPEPRPFQDTIEMGLTGQAAVEARARGYEIPRAEVFYSQYRYVVGYDGITSLVDDLNRETTRRQFGVPLTVYVTDFAGEDVRLTDEGYVRVPDRSAPVAQWVSAPEAYFVVDSPARVPGDRPAVLPFSDGAEAAAFVEDYGGSVVGWSAVREMDFGTAAATRERLRAAVGERRAWANGTVEDVAPLLDRPVSVVVGEDAPSLDAAIARAPPNTTVYLPPGTYRGNVTVEKPITIRGAGEATVVNGTGNDSVIRAYSPRVAVANLSITGVGSTKSAENPPVDESGWDYRVQMGYGYGDAGVEFEDANGSLVGNVSVETPANGILFRSTEGAVVDGVSVNGSEVWRDGFMGVMVMRSRVVVQSSSFTGGRDGVYTHLAHGLVVRNNRMTDMRFGVHEMYTSRALVENNTVRRTNIGIVVMTRPTGNAVVGNDVRDSREGVSVAGSDSYVAGNVVLGNDRGLAVVSSRSVYVRNVVVRNDVGIRAEALLPTNLVTENDVVANDRPAMAILGPLRVWSGNYWATAPGADDDGDGYLDRPYQPTGTVDRLAGRVPGVDALVRSPAAIVLRVLSEVVPGLRSTGVVDDRPRATPVGPDVLSETNAIATVTVRPTATVNPTATVLPTTTVHPTATVHPYVRGVSP